MFRDLQYLQALQTEVNSKEAKKKSVNKTKQKKKTRKKKMLNE